MSTPNRPGTHPTETAPTRKRGSAGRLPPDLPTGTVTLLFTDIEGSTRLSQRVGEARYAELLEAHRRLLRKAVQAHDGQEFGTEGDALFAVFRSAEDAVAAAAAGQLALAGHPWPGDAVVRVRMGVHTGEVAVTDGGYVGLALHRVARIAAAAHGGQVLVSGTTRDLAERAGGATPDGLEFIELGRHRLKDFDDAERLFQLSADGLQGEFPPLRTAEARPGSLPRQLTSFVGRTDALAGVKELFEHTRCLTLTGPAGAGKTRLAIRLAEMVAGDVDDRVYFVPLEPIRDPHLLDSVIAGALAVVPAAGRSTIEAVADALGDRPTLLLLDNFEQIAAAAPTVSELLRAAPRLRVIVTSRGPLRVAGEREFIVPTLRVPDLGALPPLSELAGLESVALFVERATAIRADFTLTAENAVAVAEICARLDGLPLAIELAAARTRLLSPQAISARLERRLAMLSGGSRDGPERQQTLRAAIAWSHDLLGEPQRALFARLAVFAGGAALDDIEVVTDPDGSLRRELGGDVLDGLAALVDQSLVTASAADEPRYGMLQTIREFAAEQLTQSGDAPTIRRRHTGRYLELAEAAAPNLTGRDRAHWLDRLAIEHDNCRAAIDWAIAADDAETAGRFLSAMWRFWQSRNHLAEGARLADSILALGSRMSPVVRARAHEATGGIAWWRGDMERVRAEYTTALDLAREIGDRRLLADSLYNLSFPYSLADAETARAGTPFIEEAAALYRELGDDAGLARAMWALGGGALYASGEYEVARSTLAESLALATRIGDAFLMGWSLRMLGSADMLTGHLSDAWRHLREAMTVMRAAGETTGLVLVLDDIAQLSARVGDRDRAGRLTGAARALERATGAGLGGVTWGIARERSADAWDPAGADDIQPFIAEGAALDVAAAVELALGLSEPAPPGTEAVAGSA